MPIDPAVSRTTLWIGRVMSALPVLLVGFGSIMKLMGTASVHEGFARVGIPDHLIVPVGVIELICVLVYLIPRTAALGAILMTGLLGGATMTCLRASDPTYSIPIVVGMLAWGGLYLRHPRVRELIPFWKAAE